jgi:hypothetical protein
VQARPCIYGSRKADITRRDFVSGAADACFRSHDSVLAALLFAVFCFSVRKVWCSERLSDVRLEGLDQLKKIQ